MSLRITLVLFFILNHLLGFSQINSPANSGQLTGIVKSFDSKRPLSLATVSVYKIIDSKLLSYQLADNYGIFNFKGLPVKDSLEIIISHVGFQILKSKFIIPEPSEKVDLKTLLLLPKPVELKEVAINYKPPVQMNGDTLEFNASAFRLDSNAVVEDLMKKLPGFTIWGDGKITINGRSVSNVLVDGKPFFGGDTRIATQNLPKNSVDKIQVYTKWDTNRSPLDSILEVNIKLKANRRTGLFGKIGAGAGSNKRDDANVTASMFSPRDQLAIVGARNNINLLSDDVNTLINNGSYKGVGVNIEYQPDFDVHGLYKSTAAGFTYLHFLAPNEGPNRNMNVGLDYYVTDIDRLSNQTLESIINIGNDKTLLQRDTSFSDTKSLNNRFKTHYVYQTDAKELFIRQNFNIYSGVTHENWGIITESDSILQSQRSVLTDLKYDNKDYTINATYNDKLKFFQINYSAGINENTSSKDYKLHYFSPFDDSNFDYDRSYTPNYNRLANQLDLKVDSLDNYIFGKGKLHNMGISLLSTTIFNREKFDDNVQDLDPSTGSYLPNNYLTNNAQYKVFDQQAGIRLERNFYKVLTERFRKKLYVSAEMRGQFFYHKNSSDKDFQVFSQKFYNFIPKVDLNFLNNQFESHQYNYNLNYLTYVTHPMPNQTVPLIDSVNVFYFVKGNPDLIPSKTQRLSFSVDYVNFRSKGVVNNFKFYINADKTNNAFSDSVLYDNIGRAVSSAVNVKERENASIGAEVRKSLKYSSHQILLTTVASVNYSRVPRFINSDLYTSKNIFSDGSLSIFYSFKELVALELKEKWTQFSSKQVGPSATMFKSTFSKTIGSLSVNLMKRLSLSSNYSITTNSGSYLTPKSFHILNANVSARFMKGNNAELKFSALDLLKQNTGALNYINENTISVGNVNVLKGYYLLSFSYFPRFFPDKAPN